MPGTIIGGNLQIEGNLNIWTSASISSGGNISATSLSANYIDFNTSATITEHKLGRLHWEDDDKTLDLDLDGGSVLQIGQETLIRAQNNTGSTITNGQVVYINGAQGNRATVWLADADILSASCVIAMATQSITHNNTGFFTAFGLVRDINTSAFTEGVEIYLSSAAGGFTSTKPTYPASVVSIGYVVRSHATNGSIFFNSQRVSKYEDSTTTPTQLNYLNTTSANIQTQLSRLSATDSTKANTTTTITAGTMLSGGGSLAANRTISHQTVGTSGTYSNFITNSTGHITSARALIASDLPSGIDATKIADGSVTSTEFQYINTLSANAQTQINSLSSTSHTHSNKSTLDLINQSLNTSANVSFGVINLSAQGGTTSFTTTIPPRYIGQTMALNDNWKIYGESYDGDDLGALVFEVGDNGDEAIIWCTRNTSNVRNEIMYLDRNGLYITSGLELPGLIAATKSNDKVVQLNNISLGDNLSANTLWIQGVSDSNRANIQFGNKTTGGIFGYNNVYFNSNKPIVSENYIQATGPIFADYAQYNVQSITTTSTWDSKASKDISNAGSAYTITLPSEYSDVPFYVTTSTLSNTVTVQRSGGDVIHLNGAAGTTSITLSSNTYYNVIYRSSTGKWYFTS